MRVKVRSELANLRARANRNGGLMVDDKQRTSVPNLYAAGDVTSGTSLPFVRANRREATDIYNNLAPNYY
jgi:pyruvate/2-oxoglutarate dehydrogenase complex dihydrolipoamide dehydrogenase (E3) component